MRLAAALAAIALASGSAVFAAPQAPRLFDDSKLITTDRISVEVIGHGRDVVFIPGLASSRETWKATAERLKDHYRLHLVQVAGFAGEPARANASGPVLVPTAEAIDAYVRENGLAPAVMVGHSLGGTMILWLAEHHPEDLKKALVVDAAPWLAQVFVSPSVTAEQATEFAERIRTAPPLPESAEAKMVNSVVSAPTGRDMVLGWEKVSDPKVVANALADDLELDLRPGLPSIRTPITLLFPDNTPLGAPPGAMAPIYKANFAAAPSIKLEEVDHSVHFIMFDQPGTFAADLDAFLAG